MTFLRGAAQRPHHAYVFAGPEGSGKSLAARAFAASLLCTNRGTGSVAIAGSCSLRAASNGASSTGGARHPRRRRPRRGVASRLPDPAGTGPEGLPDPRSRPAVTGGRRHTAEGLGGATGRRHLPPAVGSGARAPGDDLEPVPHRDLHGAQRAVRGRTARGRGRRADPGTARRAPGRREPGPRAADGGGRRRAPVPRRGGARIGDRRRGAGGGASGRRRGHRGGGRPQERTRARTRRRAGSIPRREGAAGGGVPGLDPEDRDPVPPTGAPSRTRPSRSRADGGVVLVYATPSPPGPGCRPRPC